MHTRHVECRGYERDDGLWDIEGHLVDTKPYDMPNDDRVSGKIAAGEALHEMWIRLTVDAILRRDYPVIQGVILLFSLAYVFLNLAIDLSYGLFDPRIRL